MNSVWNRAKAPNQTDSMQIGSITASRGSQKRQGRSPLQPAKGRAMNGTPGSSLRKWICLVVASAFSAAIIPAAVGQDFGWRPVTTTREVPTTVYLPPPPVVDYLPTTVTTVEYVPRTVRYVTTANDWALPAADAPATPDTPPAPAMKQQTFASDSAGREDRIIVHKPVWVKREREELVTVRKPVIETGERVEKYTVRKPVVETSEREETYTVLRPIYETAEREVRTTVCRPVYETAEREETVTMYQPTVSYQTYYAGFGQYTSVPVTSYAPTQVIERVPTQTVRYVEEQEVRKVPVQTVRYVEERKTRKVPVETVRYVEEQHVRKVPVERIRYVEEQQVRKVPVTP